MLQPKDTAIEWVKPPLQERSQRTLARLLDAAEATIREHGVEGASVAAVAKRAGSSVGAFYARFPDKDALVRAVADRFAEEAWLTIDSVLTPSRWVGRALDDVLRMGFLFMLRVAREQRPLLSGLIIQATRDPEIEKRLDGISLHLGTRLSSFLDARGELDKSRPLAAGVFSAIVLSTLESYALRRGPSPFSEGAMAEELTQLAIAYLRPLKEEHRTRVAASV